MSGRKRPEKPPVRRRQVAQVNTDMAPGQRQAKRHLRIIQFHREPLLFEVSSITARCSRRARGLILVSSCPYEKSRIGRWRREAGKTVPRVRNFGENVFLVDFRPFSTPHIICWLFPQTPFGYSDSPSNSASAGTTRKFRTRVKIVLKTPRRDAGRRFSA